MRSQGTLMGSENVGEVDFAAIVDAFVDAQNIARSAATTEVFPTTSAADNEVIARAVAFARHERVAEQLSIDQALDAMSQELAEERRQRRVETSLLRCSIDALVSEARELVRHEVKRAVEEVLLQMEETKPSFSPDETARHISSLERRLEALDARLDSSQQIGDAKGAETSWQKSILPPKIPSGVEHLSTQVLAGADDRILSLPTPPRSSLLCNTDSEQGLQEGSLQLCAPHTDIRENVKLAVEFARTRQTYPCQGGSIRRVNSGGIPRLQPSQPLASSPAQTNSVHGAAASKRTEQPRAFKTVVTCRTRSSSPPRETPCGSPGFPPHVIRREPSGRNLKLGTKSVPQSPRVAFRQVLAPR